MAKYAGVELCYIQAESVVVKFLFAQTLLLLFRFT